MAQESPEDAWRREAKCGVCLHTLWAPVLLPRCGHSFCEMCVRFHPAGVNNGKMELACAVCRVSSDGAVPNFQLRQLVASLHTVCPHTTVRYGKAGFGAHIPVLTVCSTI